MVILSPTEEPLLIVQQKAGWTQVKNRNGLKRAIKPKPADFKVTVLEMTEQEAIDAVKAGLGGSYLVQQEFDKRLPERAKRWLVPPFPKAGARDSLMRARDHVQWYHGTYAGDAINGGFKTLKQITAAHDEMHDPDAIGGLFMDKPHTHKEK